MEMIRINTMDCPALLYSVSVNSSRAKTLIQTQHPSERPITEACPYGLNFTSATEHKLNIIELDIVFYYCFRLSLCYLTAKLI